MNRDDLKRLFASQLDMASDGDFTLTNSDHRAEVDTLIDGIIEVAVREAMKETDNLVGTLKEETEFAIGELKDWCERQDTGRLE